MTHFAQPDQETPIGCSPVRDRGGVRSSTHPPVFLHCGWRTRGTWIWNRFRAMRGVTGYYEPLAARVAGLRANSLSSISAESWPSGHRGLDRPYYDEFRPLLRPHQRGVPGFQSRFATAGFFATPDHALPALERYLRSLVRAAQELGEQPVLKFCRSIGRIGWMRRHFPDAIHIVVMRDPFTQFASSLRQYVRNGNGYFLAMPLLLLAINRDLELVSRCVRHMGAELPDLAGSRSPLAACEAHLGANTPEAWYRGLLAFWIATAATIPDAVDLVIDSDALAHSSVYRSHCAFELANLTGRQADFSDADESGDTGTPRPPLLRRSEILRAHAGAEAFVTEHSGPAWADTYVLGHVAGKLAEARSRALGAGVAGRPPNLQASGGEPDFAPSLLPAMARAAWAERELAAIRASRSWRVTAPLRWLRNAGWRA